MEKFMNWLTNEKGLKENSAKSTISRVSRIQKGYDLEQEYEADGLESVMVIFENAISDAKEGLLPKINIGIDGDYITGLGSLKRALALYKEYKTSGAVCENKNTYSASEIKEENCLISTHNNVFADKKIWPRWGTEDMHILYTYDSCTESYNTLGKTTITSHRHIIHYESSDYVLTPQWSIVSGVCNENESYQITQVNSVDDIREAKKRYLLNNIKCIQNNEKEVVLSASGNADYSFEMGQSFFGFTEDSMIVLANDDSYKNYVVKINDKTVICERIKLQNAYSILAVPCMPCRNDYDIVYTEYVDADDCYKMLSEKYCTTCKFDRIRGYNDRHIYFERSGRTYVVCFDLHKPKNFDNIFKKYKGVRPYYIDFSNDTIYFYLKEENIIRGYDLSGNQVDEWKVPAYMDQEALLFVGKRLFIVLGRIEYNGEAKEGYMKEYDREGNCIYQKVIDESFGVVNRTCVDYIAGEPCILGGVWGNYGIMSIKDAMQIYKYSKNM